MARTVLFVCAANTCRSVMAHVLLEHLLAQRGESHAVRVRSAGIGIHARDGMIPSLDARLALKEQGIVLAEEALASTDLRSHPELVAEADVILTMTAPQKTAVAALEEARGRPVFTLREFAGEEGDIADPFGTDDDRYRACRDEIRRCLERSMDRLVATPSGATPA